MTYSMNTNIREVMKFFKQLGPELEAGTRTTVNKCAVKAEKRSSKAIRYGNPRLVGVSAWKPLRYIYHYSDEAKRKRRSKYPTETLKLTGRMMNSFYHTPPSGTLRSGIVWTKVHNRAPYFDLMEKGGSTSIHQNGEVIGYVYIPPRPSLECLAKYQTFKNECKKVLSGEIGLALRRSKRGVAA